MANDSGWTRFWRSVGSALSRFWRSAQERGITPELIELAVTYALAYSDDRKLSDAERATIRARQVATLAAATGITPEVADRVLTLAENLIRQRKG